MRELFSLYMLKVCNTFTLFGNIKGILSLLSFKYQQCDEMKLPDLLLQPSLYCNLCKGEGRYQ